MAVFQGLNEIFEHLYVFNFMVCSCVNVFSTNVFAHFSGCSY